VPAPLAVTTTSLPGGTVGETYSARLSATGGVTPYTWSLASG
jgi:endoglucanase